MNRYLIYALAVAIGIAGILCARLRAVKSERDRYAANQESLLSDVEIYRTDAGNNAASVQRLELTVDEIKKQKADLVATLEELQIKTRRLQSAALTATQTILELRAALRDTIVVRDTVGILALDSLRVFRWRDPWTDVRGVIRNDSISLRIASVDTLRQVVHRVPRKWWFIRWGTRAIRQEVVSSNPYTKIIYSEYIELKK